MKAVKLISESIIVFIIDDDDDDQQFLKEALLTLHKDNSCYFFRNAVEGLEKLRNGSLPRPDLVFADINMPMLDGKQFLKLIKSDPHLDDIPVVMYSTAFCEEEVKTLIGMGAESFLQKTSEFSLLQKSLQSILSAVASKKRLHF